MAKLKNSLTNVDGIIKELKKKAKYLTSIEKLDGITIECSVAKTKKAEDKIEDVKAICKTLVPYQAAIELNEKFDNVFIIQFPELVPEYTDEEINKMYMDSFKWLVDNFKTNDAASNYTPELFMRQKDKFVKHAILIYYRSNTNQYRCKPEDLLNDKEYRTRIDSIFIDYINGNI